MGVPLWARELAETFWSAAGGDEPFPRNLRGAVAYALPLPVVLLPRLRVAGVDAWLREQGVNCDLAVGDRPLRACLIACFGQGLAFVDGADAEDEQRFSLAHEAAHFLRDYWAPRRVAAERLGAAVLEVLDGERAAREEERIHALLARVSIGFHVHLMERSADGRAASAAIDTAEHGANLLACELLAPSATVLAQAGAFPVARRREAVTRLLVDDYGLPPGAAAGYAALLFPRADPAGSFVRRLGLGN